MSDEPLNLSNELLKSEELDVEGHLKDGADESEDKGEGRTRSKGICSTRISSTCSRGLS